MSSVKLPRLPESLSTTGIATLCLIMAMVLWSSSFIALKIAFRGYDPHVVIFGRMLVASICFMAAFKRIANGFNYRKGDYKLLLFMVLCEPCFYFLFEAKAVKNTSASQAGVITAILPVLVMIAAAFFLKEFISRKSWAGAIAALIGVIWLTLASAPDTTAPHPVLGNFLEFMAMVCATGYTISLKYLTSRYSPFMLTALQAFVGCIFYLPILFLPSTTFPEKIPWQPTLAIIYLGGIITIGAYGLYNFAIKQVPANKAASFVNLIPIFAVLLGWLVLGETLNIYQIFAGCLIMAGVYLTQK